MFCERNQLKNPKFTNKKIILHTSTYKNNVHGTSAPFTNILSMHQNILTKSSTSVTAHVVFHKYYFKILTEGVNNILNRSYFLIFSPVKQLIKLKWPNALVRLFYDRYDYT